MRNRKPGPKPNPSAPHSRHRPNLADSRSAGKKTTGQTTVHVRVSATKAVLASEAAKRLGITQREWIDRAIDLKIGAPNVPSP